jgi:hypothetical protein
MQLALIQPQFAPNLFDLASMMKADRVVFADTDRWSRKGRTHRALIRNEEGTQWINLPIRTEDKKKSIREVRIDQSEDWFEPFWNALWHNYQQSMYFDHLCDEVEALFLDNRDQVYLIDFNDAVFGGLLKMMELELGFDYASQAPPDPQTPTVIYQEFDSRHYIKQRDDAATSLSVHPEYRQAWPGFVEGCSCLDLLFNYGPESYRVLDLLR